MKRELLTEETKTTPEVSTVFTTLPERQYHDRETMVIWGDSQQCLHHLRSASVPLICADPPYNLGKSFEEEVLPQPVMLAWYYQWLEECLRILAPHGTMYLLSSTALMPHLDCYLSTRSWIRSRIVWCYDSSGVQAKHYFGSLYEPILMVVKDPHHYTFNHQAVMVDTTMGAKRKLIDYRRRVPQRYHTQKVLGNVWQIPRVRYLMPEYETHPTQKPEKLLEIMIRASSHPHDIVLDPFAGSFTTGAVAQRLHRKFIGIEILEEYYKIGLRRLGLATSYHGEPLVKVKQRLTDHRSKQDHVFDMTSAGRQRTLLDLADDLRQSSVTKRKVEL